MSVDVGKSNVGKLCTAASSAAASATLAPTDVKYTLNSLANSSTSLE